ncbi:MAG: hypothetical protein NZ951_01660 [Dehalococcoidia bacterium]|nr:hypothetical protein [Dehalococcoidia bacterium]MDW8119537.1 hypothetical protein [Chloroflexota bacterium]
MRALVLSVLLGCVVLALGWTPHPQQPPSITLTVDREWVSAVAGGSSAQFTVTVRAPGANQRPDVVDALGVVVRNLDLGLAWTVVAPETGPNTGVFQAQVTVRNQVAGLQPTEVGGFHLNTLEVFYPGAAGARVRVDDQPPLVRVVSPPPGAILRPGEVQMVVEVADALSGFPTTVEALQANAVRRAPGFITLEVGAQPFLPSALALERIPQGWRVRLTLFIGGPGSVVSLPWSVVALDLAGNRGGPTEALRSVSTVDGSPDGTSLVDANWVGTRTEFWVGRQVQVLTGPARGQVRTVSAFTPQEGRLTFAQPFTDPSGRPVPIAAGVLYEFTQTLLLSVDGVPPILVSAETGSWWDATAPPGERLKRQADARRTSIRLTFSDDSGLDEASILPRLFRVGGETPIGVQVVDIRNESLPSPQRLRPLDVFLTLPRPLPSDALPVVTIAEGIKDKAGNVASVGQVVANDGIGPSLTATVDKTLTRDSVTIRVVADEALRGVPQVVLGAQQDAAGTVAPAAPLAMTPAGGGAYTLQVVGSAHPLGNAVPQRVHVLVQAVDIPGNPGWAGSSRVGPSALVYEFDPVLNGGREPVVKVGDTVVEGGRFPTIALSDPLFISVDWSAEGAEYLGDSHARVEMVGVDVRIGDTPLSAAVSTQDGVRYLIVVANPQPGDYILAFSGRDAAGNQSLLPGGPETTVFRRTFRLQVPTPMVIPLTPGWNIISLPFAPASRAVNSVLADTDVDMVMTWDGVAGTFLVARRNPTTRLFEGDISTLEVGRGYYVRSTSFRPLRLTPAPAGPGGPPPQPPAAISLRSGWNLIGIVSGARPPVASLPADAYFATLRTAAGTPAWSRAYWYDSVTQTWHSLTPGQVWPAGSIHPCTGVVLTAPQPAEVCVGKGYWVFVPQDSILVP